MSLLIKCDCGTIREFTNDMPHGPCSTCGSVWKPKLIVRKGNILDICQVLCSVAAAAILMCLAAVFIAGVILGFMTPSWTQTP